jgi:hypothetical protein
MADARLLLAPRLFFFFCISSTYMKVSAFRLPDRHHESEQVTNHIKRCVVQIPFAAVTNEANWSACADKVHPQLLLLPRRSVGEKHG